MARRKNTKFIDPRYFMNEKMERLDEKLQEGPPQDFLVIADREGGGIDKLLKQFGMTWNFEDQHSDGSITLTARDDEQTVKAALQGGIDNLLQKLIQNYNQKGRGGTLVGNIRRAQQPHGAEDRFGGNHKLRITLSGQ